MEPKVLNPEIGIGHQSELVITEYSESTNVAPLENAKEIELNPDMPYRRIYFFAEVDLSDALADYIVASELVFLKAGSQVGRPLPVTLGREDIVGTNVLGGQSRINICTGTNIPGANSIFVVFSNKFNAASAFLNPCLLKMDANRLRLRINRVKANGANTVTKYRAFIAVLSSISPWSG